MGFEALEDRHLLSVSLSLNGTQTITPGATIDVSNVSGAPAGWNTEMSLVVNPTNPLNLVGFSHRIAAPITLDVYRSFDGGATWATTQIDNTDDGLTAGVNRFDPTVAFDANGVLYIAYGVRGSAGPPATQTRLVGAVSTDGGANFINFRVIDAQNDPNGGGTAPPGLDKWYIATGVDPNSGNQAAYISYVHYALEGAMGTTPDDRIMVAGTRDGGANWTAPLNINDPSMTGSNTGSSYASPVVGRLGELAVSWHDSNSNTIFLDRDLDGLWATGSNFGADVTVRTGVTVNRSVDIPPAQPERGINAAPMLEVNQNLGWLYMPYVNRDSISDVDIWVGRSTDFGENWTFDRIDSSSGDEFNPWLQVDQRTGVVNVLYYTTEGDAATGNDDVRPRLASSFDNGNTWSRVYLSNQTSNEAGGTTNDYLEYIGLAARDGTVHGLWASRYPGGGTDLDAFTANAGFVSSTGDNRLIINQSGGDDDYFVIQQSPQNSAFLEVFVDGVREYTGLSTTLDKIIINPGAGTNTINIGTLTGISSITINGTNNADTINVEALGSGAPLTMVLAGGNDIVTLAPNNPFGVAVINAPVTIYGEDGDDTLNIGSGNADILNANISFDGGASVLGNNVVYYDTSSAYQVVYDIGGSSVVRDGLLAPFTLSYSNVQLINLQCGGGADIVNTQSGVTATIQAFGYGGPDHFTIGSGTVGFLPASIFDGGGGIDMLTFDDHLSSANSTTIIEANFVTFFGGVFAVSTQAFESVEYLAGTGNNTLRIVDDMTQNISVDGGDGNDSFYVEHAFNYQDYDDSGQGGSPPFHYTMDLDGGSGFNYLAVDDTLDFDRSYAIWPDRMLIDEGAPLGLDFNYDSFQSVDVLSPPNPLQFTPTFHIFGTSSDIPFTHQMSIIGSSAADQFIVHPHDAQGNLTINGNLGLGGGDGFDTLVVDDTLFPTTSPINYSFYNQFGPGTTNIGGLGAAGFGASSNIESITINAGNGDDNFTIDSFKSGSALAINAGGGVDRLYISPNTKNLPIDVGSISSFNFDGGDGPDFFYLYNDNNILPWTYTRTADYLRTDTALGYSVDWNLQSAEYLDVTGGTQPDAFLIQSTPASFESFSNAFRGAGGNDSYVVGLSGRTNQIIANVALVDDADDDSATVDNSADTIGRTVHVDTFFVGGVLGDDLFGPGGYVYHVNLDGNLTVQLGSGADTIYAQPHQATSINLQANNPTTAPGDSLTLALAAAQNVVVTGTTNGNVTSTNLEPLTWTGIETLATDATTPTVDIVDVTPDPRTTNVGSITIDFSEAVSNFSVAQMTLTRNGGADLLQGVATLTSSDQIHWTLGNLAGVTNISGNYLLTVVAGTGLADLAGNLLLVGATDAWTANIASGDANGDNTVDIFDVNVVSQNWGTAGPSGDVNNDGVVDIFDINLISANWGMGGGGGGAEASAGAGGGAGAGLFVDNSSPPTSAAATVPPAAGTIAGPALRVASERAGVAHAVDATSTSDSISRLRLRTYTMRRLAAVDILFRDGRVFADGWRLRG